MYLRDCADAQAGLCLYCYKSPRQIYSVAVQLLNVSFYHERVENEMRNLIIVKYYNRQNCYFHGLFKAFAVCM